MLPIDSSKPASELVLFQEIQPLILSNGRKVRVLNYPVSFGGVSVLRYILAGLLYGVSQLSTGVIPPLGMVRPPLTDLQVVALRTTSRDAHLANIILGYSGGCQPYHSPVCYQGSRRTDHSSLTLISSELKTFLDDKEDPFSLFEIPLAVLHNGQSHAVSLVFNRCQKEIYFIDTLGGSVHDTFFRSINNAESTGKTVSNLLLDLCGEIPELTDGWTVMTTSFIQKPNDCSVCAEAIIRALAQQEPGHRCLSQAQQFVHSNYGVVDDLRAIFTGANQKNN